MQIFNQEILTETTWCVKIFLLLKEENYKVCAKITLLGKPFYLFPPCLMLLTGILPLRYA